MGAPRIAEKVLDYLKNHPNRVLSNSRIASRVGSSTGGSQSVLKRLAADGEPIEFVKIGAGRYVHVRYNDPNYVPPKKEKPKDKPLATPDTKVAVGMTLTLTLEDGTTVSLTEAAARELVAKLRRVFGAQ